MAEPSQFFFGTILDPLYQGHYVLALGVRRHHGVNAQVAPDLLLEHIIWIFRDGLPHVPAFQQACLQDELECSQIASMDGPAVSNQLLNILIHGHVVVMSLLRIIILLENGLPHAVQVLVEVDARVGIEDLGRRHRKRLQLRQTRPEVHARAGWIGRLALTHGVDSTSSLELNRFPLRASAVRSSAQGLHSHHSERFRTKRGSKVCSAA